MDYDQLAYDLQHAPGVRLLNADHAALIISFLHRQFKREQRIAIPLAELAERLANTLEVLNEQAPGSFPRPAQSYLTEWADEQHNYIRITTPASSDTPLVELTAETERAIGWIEELHGQPFVGTESRFLHIVQLLREIMQKSTVDPVERLAQLEQQRDAIQQQIDQIRQSDLQPVIHEGRILSRLPSHLLAAGEQVVQSNAGLAQQLRRMLDEQSIAERRRVRAIVSEIKQMAFRATGSILEEGTFIELEGPPETHLVMEHGLWEPGETFSVADLPVNATDEELAFGDLLSLHTQFHIDKALLYRNIEELLDIRAQVTLADVLAHYPPEKGLAEVLAYCTLAANDPDHTIDEQQTETIDLPVATPSGREMRTLTIPRVLYQRRTYAD